MEDETDDEREAGYAGRDWEKVSKVAIASGTIAAVVGAAGGAVTGPGALVGAGVGFVGGTAGELLKAAVEKFEGATDRLERAAEHEKARALEDAVPELAARIERLRAQIEDERDLVSNLRALLHAWSRAWDRSGDSKKHRVLMAALVKGLDRESYKSGLTLRLFRILEDLDYPEIQFLRTAFAKPGMGLVPNLRGLQDTAPSRDSETREHLERLAAHRLVCWTESVASDDAKSIARTARRTWLGEQLLLLCADREAVHRFWPDAEPNP
ncbi:MAG: hypothetical protein M5U28_23165 [Sandaracinaceae bacterium]|nr:hypothetical protein [Sandaracinaceae bacterium]